MRWSKRIATGILTALLAFSMLTACGVSGAPSGGNTGNGGTNAGTGTDTGTGIGGDNSNTGTGSDTGKEDGTLDPSTQTSRAAKYFARQGMNGAKKYIRYTVGYEAGYTGNYWIDWIKGDWIEACDGRRKYCQNPVRDFDNKKYTKAELYDRKENTFYSWYILDGGKHITQKNWTTTTIWVSNVSFVPENLATFSTTPVEPMTIDNVEYYCERDDDYYANYNKQRYYCFEKTDVAGQKLKYIVTDAGIVEIIKVDEVTSNFDMNLLRIPEGYYIDMEDGNTSIGPTGKDTYPN